MLLIAVGLTVGLGTSARMAEQARTDAQGQGPRVVRSGGASPAGQPDEPRIAVRRATFAYNCARWEREWQAVEPIWSKGEDRRG